VSAAAAYRNLVNQRANETQGMSPVAIGSTMEINGSNVTLTGTFRLVDPVSLNDLRGTLLLYEDNVFWCCGYGGVDTWEHVTRVIYDENITLSGVGDEATIQTTIPIPAGWNIAELHAAAYVQRLTSKEMVQAQLIGQGATLDYSVWFEVPVRSVPEGNGTAVFDAILTNISDANDTFTIEPGAGFGTWMTDFLVCGDNTPYSVPHQIVLAPDASCEIQFRVHTDAALAVRSGQFSVSSGATGRAQDMTVRVFNGSYSVLVVDDDGANPDEVPLTNALTSLGYVFEDWDIFNGHGSQSPTFSNMNGFDYVIWQTGLRFTGLLTEGDESALAEFMDGGGSVFLASQEYIDTQSAGDPFVTNYLGVASWVLDRSYVQMNGVAGDPIGDGLSLPLHFNIPSFNKGDHIVPGANAAGCFTAPDGSISTVRHTMPLRNNAKAVFMATPFNAISESDPDPNNTRVTLQRIMDWLQPEAPTAVDAVIPVRGLSRVVGATPNPFNPRTEIAFEISTADAGPVRLEIFDASGRKVAALRDGNLPAGPHVETWDGTTSTGAPVESGVYFARLTTRSGETSAKLTLLK
jgi:hypothetical protein